MTLAIIILTALVSIFSFQNRTWFDKLKLNPYRLYYKKEWGRILSHGFIHADWTHLIVNMFVLYSFGRAVEYYFNELRVAGYMSFPIIHFLLLYLGGIIISSIPSILKQKNHEFKRCFSCQGKGRSSRLSIHCLCLFSPGPGLCVH